MRRVTTRPDPMMVESPSWENTLEQAKRIFQACQQHDTSYYPRIQSAYAHLSHQTLRTEYNNVNLETKKAQQEHAVRCFNEVLQQCGLLNRIYFHVPYYNSVL
jgi:hypothetical protein